MDLQQYLHAVRTHWWAVLTPVALAVAFGLYLVAAADSEYRASVTFFIATSSDASTQGAVQGDEFAQRRVNSYLGLLTTDRLAGNVIEETGLALTPGQVKAMIGADADVDTVLLTATVTDSSRDVVTQVADAVSTEFVELIDELENQGPAQGSVDLEVVSGPSVTELPPRRALMVGIPGVIGLVLGLALVWLLELRDKTIRSDAELVALHPVPVLGTIPVDRRLRDAPRLSHEPASSAGIESFRQLRTNLEFIDIDTRVQVLVVTSAVAAEGKTTTVTNIAAALAAADKRVLVVEADLRRPTLDEYFAVEPGVGLTDVVVGHAELDAALRPVGPRGLVVLPSGQPPPNPSELLGSEAMAQLLERLRPRFDNILISTPPLLPVTDAAVLAAVADGVVVVVRAGKTTRHQLMQAMRSLQAVGARVLGTVLNMAPSHRGPAYRAYWRTGGRTPEPPGTEDEVASDGTSRRNGGPPVPTPGNGRRRTADARSLSDRLRSVVSAHLAVPLHEGHRRERGVRDHQRRIDPQEAGVPEHQREAQAQHPVVGGDDGERVERRRRAVDGQQHRGRAPLRPADPVVEHDHEEQDRRDDLVRDRDQQMDVGAVDEAVPADQDRQVEAGELGRVDDVVQPLAGDGPAASEPGELTVGGVERVPGDEQPADRRRARRRR